MKLTTDQSKGDERRGMKGKRSEERMKSRQHCIKLRGGRVRK